MTPAVNLGDDLAKRPGKENQLTVAPLNPVFCIALGDAAERAILPVDRVALRKIDGSAARLDPDTVFGDGDACPLRCDGDGIGRAERRRE
jgi:hypothetical protein